MERKIYKLTAKQIKKAQALSIEIPSDEEIKTQWARSHHGKTAGWGMQKALLITQSYAGDVEYQRGLWQGRVDAARGLGYSEERSEKAYNLGYYRGYDNYESDRYGWDAATRENFDKNYVED